MMRVCQGANVVRGIDVSRWQGKLDWTAEKASGVEFAFTKATEGLTINDSTFQYNWAGLKTVGVMRGAYHFFHPGLNALNQAEYFCNTVGSLQKGDLPLMLDWESTDGVPSSSDKEDGFTFLQAVEHFSKKTPIIYTGPYFAQALSLDERFAKYPLFVAHYGVRCPLVPEPWKNWTFWQYSGTGIDHDLFNGILDQLKVMCI